jgi:putative phosphoserine phosphatase/1-acylglycerol-3-phosphate O-acyltransferase
VAGIDAMMHADELSGIGRGPGACAAAPRAAGAREWIGTLAAVAAVDVGAALALGAGLLHSDRRLAVSACAAGLETALALAGVRVRVIGQHNLWAARSAVVVMNHQSGLDAMVTGALVRHDFTAAGKKETKHDPRTALLTRALDIVFLHRSETARDRHEMGKLVERLRHGTSALVAPEGTRTPNRRGSRPGRSCRQCQEARDIRPWHP